MFGFIKARPRLSLILGQTMAIRLFDVFQHAIVRDQLVANTVLVVLATTMLMLRFVSRRIRESRIWWDDGCCVLSMVCIFLEVGFMALWLQLADGIDAYLRYAGHALSLCSSWDA